MRFEESYEGWKKGRLTQEEAARLLGICERTYRRYLVRYEHNAGNCSSDFLSMRDNLLRMYILKL